MNKPMALLFAIISVLLLCGVSISMSYQNLWLVALFSAASILFIGFGFMLKAKIRKRNQTRPQ